MSETEPATAATVEIISPDVECPWCGAKPGQPCRIQDSSPQGWHFGYREGHAGRTKSVPADSREVGRVRGL